MDQPSHLRAHQQECRWENVENLPYKDEGSAPFKAISRQTLFDEAGLACQLRYFEMDVGGHSTLERHEHMHAVMILRGHGTCLVGGEVREVKPLDLISIPAWAWHQFRASAGEKMGFLCMVNQTRDKPQLPGAGDLAALLASPAIASFLQATADPG